jgi:hypothetical protein
MTPKGAQAEQPEDSHSLPPSDQNNVPVIHHVSHENGYALHCMAWHGMGGCSEWWTATVDVASGLV